MTSKPRRSGAIAILYRENRFLLQLRDNFPHIVFPNQWTMFGGHIEPEEPPEEAIYREIWEEVHYKADKFSFFGQYDDEDAYRYVFHAPLTVPLDQLSLNEGYDMAMVSVAEIEQGKCYSEKAQGYRLLVPIHRQILLEFINSHLNPQPAIHC
ncbi:MAG: NUDIX domain-containing protein [Microcystaceae cyanobacterium]